MAIVRDRSGNDVQFARTDLPLDRYRRAITPSDTVVQFPTLDAIYVGGAGDITVKNDLGVTVLHSSVSAGTTLLVSGAHYVMATSTTATGLVGITDRALR